MPMLPLLIAINAVLVTMSSTLSASFVYDRQLIRSGELWRLVTGHLVHFSASHLCLDLCGFLLAAWHCSRKGYRHVPAVIVIAAVATTATIFLLQPDMARYGGLSGIANALVVYAVVRGFSEGEGTRWLSAAVLIVCCGNIGSQLLGSGTMLAVTDQPFVPAASAHLVGALTGTAVACLETIRLKRIRVPRKNYFD